MSRHYKTVTLYRTSVTSINIRAFSPCKNLTTVTFQGTINANNLGFWDSFNNEFISSFDGGLREKYITGGPGTYKSNGYNSGSIWTKQM